MRCMTAICPAGPPKLSSATRTHTRTASRKATSWSGAAATGALAMESSAIAIALRSSTAFHVGKIERGPQPLRELLGLIICPEMHEEKMWRIIDHVTVKCRHLDPMLAKRLHDRIDFGAQEHEISCNRCPTATSRLEVDGDSRAQRRWNDHTSLGDRLCARNAELINTTVRRTLESERLLQSSRVQIGRRWWCC